MLVKMLSVKQYMAMFPFLIFYLIRKGENFGVCRDCEIFLIDSSVSKDIQNWIQMLHLKVDVTLRLVLMRDCNWANLNCSVAAWARRKTLMIDLCGWVGISLQALWVEAEHPAGGIRKEKGEQTFITQLVAFYGSVMVNWEMNAYIHVFCTVLRH